jgi:hypothetical protein
MGILTLMQYDVIHIELVWEIMNYEGEEAEPPELLS